MGSVATELKLLAAVIEGVLSLYCYVSYSIQQQLVAITKAARALFLLFKITEGRILTNQP